MAASGESLGHVLDENLGYFETMVRLGRVSSVKRFLQSRKEQGNNAALLYNDCWAFRLAVEQGKVHLLQVLLEAVPDEQTLNALFAANNCEAPFNAIEKRNTVIIKLLLEKAPSFYTKIMQRVIRMKGLVLPVNEARPEEPHMLPVNYKEFKQAAMTGNLERLTQVLDAATPAQKNAWFLRVDTDFLGELAAKERAYLVFGLFLKHMSDEQITQAFIANQCAGFNRVLLQGNPVILTQILRRVTAEQRNVLLSVNTLFASVVRPNFDGVVRVLSKWASITQKKDMLAQVGAAEVTELVHKGYANTLEEILFQAKLLTDTPAIYSDLLAHLGNWSLQGQWQKRIEARLVSELARAVTRIDEPRLKQKAKALHCAIEALFRSDECYPELSTWMARSYRALKACDHDAIDAIIREQIFKPVVLDIQVEALKLLFDVASIEQRIALFATIDDSLSQKIFRFDLAYDEVLEELLFQAKLLTNAPEIYPSMIAHLCKREPYRSKQQWQKRLEARLTSELEHAVTQIDEAQLRQKAQAVHCAIEALLRSEKNYPELSIWMARSYHALKACDHGAIEVIIREQIFEPAVQIGHIQALKLLFDAASIEQKSALLTKINDATSPQFFDGIADAVLEELLFQAKLLTNAPEIYSNMIARLGNESLQGQWQKRLEARLVSELEHAIPQIDEAQLRQKAQAVYAAIQQLMRSNSSNTPPKLIECMVLTLNALNYPGEETSKALAQVSQQLPASWGGLRKAMLILAVGIVAGSLCAATFSVGVGAVVGGVSMLTGLATYRFFTQRQDKGVDEDEHQSPQP